MKLLIVGSRSIDNFDLSPQAAFHAKFQKIFRKRKKSSKKLFTKKKRCDIMYADDTRDMEKSAFFTADFTHRTLSSRLKYFIFER